MFNFIKSFKKTCNDLVALVARKKKDGEADDLASIKKLLLESDVGPFTTKIIISVLGKKLDKQLASNEELLLTLNELFVDLLSAKKFEILKPVVLFVGVKGSCKSSALAKLAYHLKNDGKKVLIVAGDTFRAAGALQVVELAQAIDVPVVSGAQGQDPASLVYQACDKFVSEKFDVLLIDTAGRLQNNEQLMAELAKIKRTLEKKLGQEQLSVLLVLDGMLGQNSFAQAQIFNEVLGVDGVVLTKMDGSSKGGVVFGVVQELKIPIAYVTFGESIEALEKFNALHFVNELLRENS